MNSSTVTAKIRITTCSENNRACHLIRDHKICPATTVKVVMDKKWVARAAMVVEDIITSLLIILIKVVKVDMVVKEVATLHNSSRYIMEAKANNNPMINSSNNLNTRLVTKEETIIIIILLGLGEEAATPRCITKVIKTFDNLKCSNRVLGISTNIEKSNITSMSASQIIIRITTNSNIKAMALQIINIDTYMFLY